tara:strand:- start:3476 stop:3880 length:405 start_codon:yes stop_codon:yes gene_type:complete
MYVYSLIDITETKQYRNPDKKLNHQQANFMTMIQTLCLSDNFLYEDPPKIQNFTEKKLREIGFGSQYKGDHTVWCLEVRVDEGRSEPDPKAIEENFDLIPVISNLDETIVINNNVFRTTDNKAKNIVLSKANIT